VAPCKFIMYFPLSFLSMHDIFMFVELSNDTFSLFIIIMFFNVVKLSCHTGTDTSFPKKKTTK
jgi:hypothetical protein